MGHWGRGRTSYFFDYIIILIKINDKLSMPPGLSVVNAARSVGLAAIL